ncbi:MAG: aldehyde dehydrogenase [Verrucomicrobia bacterium]|nr:MAG: aldehyde dehydrogenase [Verrucomicrobiota bacterium]
MARLPVNKTPKVYVGGAFIRSESGRTYPLHRPSGRRGPGSFLAHIPQCTRKDLRNAVEVAARAIPGWAGRSPYNRAQILYRLAEMMESRLEEMAHAISISTGLRRSRAQREVSVSIDRLVYYAGWADKFEQVLGSTNPVAGPYFNFTVCEPMGVIGVVAGTQSPLLGLISQVVPAITSGNAVVALASEAHPFPAIVLGEILAVSDLPAGVVNLLTGSRSEILPTFATHAQLRGLDAVIESPDEKRELGLGAAESVKRLHCRENPTWSTEDAESISEIRRTVEFKTIWHPVGA